MRYAFLVAAIALISASALAEAAPRPVVGFRVRGDSKLSERTAGYLAHVAIGDLVDQADLPQLEQALLSSELFKTASVALEDAPGGVLVVATLEDKQSWIIAPAIFVLSQNKAFGVGYAENNLGGNNQKLLLYGQVGTAKSIFFGTFLDPSVRGTRWRARFDVYAYRRFEDEYANPTADPTSKDISRTTTSTYLGAGALVGYSLAWWLVADLRLRAAYVYLRDAHVGDGASRVDLPAPGGDGRDISASAFLTLDRRAYRYGVTWGPYVQLSLDKSIPGLDEYGYGIALLRAYYSWRLLSEHQLQLRAVLHGGYHLPFHEELTLGGQPDLRGYAADQFRGDVRTLFRIEYSVPIVRWRWFAFRALGFFDSGYAGNHFLRSAADRDYLPTQYDGVGWWRNDVGLGLRIYVNSIVLPLLGLDVGYGLESRSPALYFALGLTDF